MTAEPAQPLQAMKLLHFICRAAARIDVYNPLSPAEPPLDPYGALPPYQGATGPVTQVYGGMKTDVEQYGLHGQLRLSPAEGLTLVGGGRMTG